MIFWMDTLGNAPPILLLEVFNMPLGRSASILAPYAFTSTCERTVCAHHSWERASRRMSGGHASGHAVAGALVLAASAATCWQCISMVQVP